MITFCYYFTDISMALLPEKKLIDLLQDAELPSGECQEFFNSVFRTSLDFKNSSKLRNRILMHKISSLA
jgi:hypothetical protein